MSLKKTPRKSFDVNLLASFHELPLSSLMKTAPCSPTATNRSSAFRSTFGEDYGVTMTTGPLAGLLSRAVVIVEPDGTVSYTQQVPEIHDEPDYELVMAALEQVY